MCPPGLHITLGVFLRLFTLLEDECHKLDLQLASMTAPLSGDRVAYVDFTVTIQMERTLLDERENLDQEIILLNQTLSLLSLMAVNPSTNPNISAVATCIQENKARLGDIVSNSVANNTKSSPSLHKGK